MDRRTLLLLAALIAFPAVAHADAVIGQASPSIVIGRLDGTVFNLSEQKGKVVVINFWSTWCAPCREEMPALDEVYRRYQSKGLVMIGVSLDGVGSRSAVENMMRPFAYKAALTHNIATNGFGYPTMIPDTFIVDANGILRDHIVPEEAPATVERLEKAIKPLLPP